MSDRLEVYEFGEFRIDTGKRLLLHAGGPVPVTPKVFDTLAFLVKRPGEMLRKEELMRAIWPDTVVEENNLNQHISTLRRILGEGQGENRYIATIPGRGYRFIAEVEVVSDGQSGVPCPVTIAVLPFENLGAGTEREYLADGLTEETIAALGRIDPDHFRRDRPYLGHVVQANHQVSRRHWPGVARSLLDREFPARRGRSVPHYVQAHSRA
jgi:DNA-binding winged helix-turn-helix (wHTH) protein